MSNEGTERTKGIRQKDANGGYGPIVPFGTDGQFVDMNSELNLEYELKLGTKHVARIDEDETTKTTTIVENYATPAESSAANSSFYRVSTKITSPNTPTTDPYYDEEGQPHAAVLSNEIKAQLYWVVRANSVETQKFIIGKETRILLVTMVEPIPPVPATDDTPAVPGVPGVYRTVIEEEYFTTEQTEQVGEEG